MKRSEMLKIIQKCSIRFNPSYKKHREEMAELILTKMEEAGMLVPLDDYQLNYISPMVFGWEPENEDE